MAELVFFYLLQSTGTPFDIELVPGYGLKISINQLDACLRKAKASGTALARLLVVVFFDEKTLASSCVRGSKSKPALDSRIIDAIISE